MAKVSVIDRNGTPVRDLELADRLFAVEWSDGCVYDTVRAQRAGRRAGTASTKVRDEVSGGGKKPWRQKGTGRARAGSSRSPLWRGGGIVFGPKPRDYSYKVPKKVRARALGAVLTDKLAAGKLLVVDGLAVEAPKTKAGVALLNSVGATGKVLVVAEQEDRNLYLALRNLPHVNVIHVSQINVYDLLWANSVVATEAAMVALQEARGQ
jgi:large subunit ribosomal protein L4